MIKLNGYISSREAAELIGISINFIASKAQANDWCIRKQDRKVYYLKSDVVKYKNNLIKIKNGELINQYAIADILEITIGSLRNILSKGMWEYKKVDGTKYYFKNDILDYKNECMKIDAKFNSGKYLTFSQSYKYMNINRTQFGSFVAEYNLIKHPYRNKVFYEKKVLDKYIEKRKNWLDTVISNYELLNNYFCTSDKLYKFLIKHKINKKKIPPYVRTTDLGSQIQFYDKNDIELHLRGLPIYTSFKNKGSRAKNLSEVQQINYENKLTEYYTLDEARQVLDINKNSFRQLRKQSRMNEYIVRYGNKHYVSINFINKIKDKQDKFWSEVYVISYVKSILPSEDISKLKNIQIPYYARCISYELPSNSYACLKSEVDKMILKYNLRKDNGNCVNILEHIDMKIYIDREEAMNLLNLNNTTMATFTREYSINYWIMKNRIYFLREDIEFFLEQQKEFGTRYITSSMAYNRYGDIKHILKRIESINIPIFCRIKSIPSNTKSKIFDSLIIEQHIDKINHDNRVKNTYGEDHFHTFKLRLDLNIDKLYVFNKSIYTKKKWYEFVSNKIDESCNVCDKGKEILIRGLISITIKINTLLKSNNVFEIYQLSTNHINFWYRGILDERIRMYIYQFLEEVHSDIKLKCKYMTNINKGFNMNKILRYNDETFRKKKDDSNSKDNQIYSYDEYYGAFMHLINIKLHVKRSLYYLEEENNDISYASVWLYSMLHLNNAWRHGDVTRFPRLYLRDIIEEWGINDIEWFKYNEISVEQSRRIVARIVQYDYKISKTDVWGHFFCSDTLAPALSTAILILEYYYLFISTDNVPDINNNDSIMQFYTQYNEPSQSLIKKCFKQCNVENFIFSSMKFNHTVLTFIYNTANEMMPSGYNALLLPKYLREHIDEMTTVEYVEFCSEQLEFLSGELFARGEFGYITDYLLNLISNKPEKSIQRTAEIKAVNSLFGTPDKLEATVGMLNSFMDERKEINKILKEFLYDEETKNISFQKCTETISKIYLNVLPSRKPNIQCLYSEEDGRCYGVPCEKCKYNIPNIYSLKNVYDSLIDNMNKYLATEHIYEKIKYASEIECYMTCFKQAISLYGEEYTYNCVDANRLEVMQLYLQIDDISNLFHKLEQRG